MRRTEFSQKMEGQQLRRATTQGRLLRTLGGMAAGSGIDKARNPGSIVEQGANFLNGSGGAIRQAEAGRNRIGGGMVGAGGLSHAGGRIGGGLSQGGIGAGAGFGALLGNLLNSNQGTAPGDRLRNPRAAQSNYGGDSTSAVHSRNVSTPGYSETKTLPTPGQWDPNYGPGVGVFTTQPPPAQRGGAPQDNMADYGQRNGAWDGRIGSQAPQPQGADALVAAQMAKASQIAQSQGLGIGRQSQAMTAAAPQGGGGYSAAGPRQYGTQAGAPPPQQGGMATSSNALSAGGVLGGIAGFLGGGPAGAAAGAAVGDSVFGGGEEDQGQQDQGGGYLSNYSSDGDRVTDGAGDMWEWTGFGWRNSRTGAVSHSKPSGSKSDYATSASSPQTLTEAPSAEDAFMSEYQKMFGGRTPTVDQQKLDQMLAANRQRSAFESAGRMRAAAERASRGGLAPESLMAMQGQDQAQTQIAQGEQETKMRYAAELENLQSRRQSIAQELSWLQMRSGQAHDAETMRLSSKLAIERAYEMAEIDKQMAQFQKDLDQPDWWDVGGALLGTGGELGAGLLANPSLLSGTG